MTTDTTRYLGGYVGPRETCDQLTSGKLGNLITHLEKLSELAKAELHAAISSHASNTRILMYKGLLLHPNKFGNHLKRISETNLLQLFQCDVSDEFRQVLRLPVKLGGMGIHDPTDTAVTNYAASPKVCDRHFQLLLDQQQEYPEDMPQIQKQEIEKIRQEKEAHQKALRATI